MQQRILGRTGLSVSALGFGSAPVGFLLTEQRQVTGVLNRLLDRGVNVIDTAAAYDGSEEAIGKAVSHRRADYVLISKCGQSFAGLPGEAWSAELITATVDRALRRLQTDHIDVMLLHSCGLNVLRNGAALEALVKAREAGKISFAGYSGDNEEAAFAATFPDIAVIEASINVCDQANLASLLPLTQKQNIGIVAKRPIANGAWRLPEQQSGLYREYARPYHERFKAMGLRTEDLGVPDRDWARLALLFTLSQPGVHTAIVGTTSPENALRNVEAVENMAVTADAILTIRGAFQRAEKQSGESWKALT